MLKLRTIKQQINEFMRFETYECPKCGMDDQTGDTCRYCGAPLRPFAAKAEQEELSKEDKKISKIDKKIKKPAPKALDYDPAGMRDASTVKVQLVSKPSMGFLVIVLLLCGITYGISYIPTFERFSNSILVFFLIGVVLLLFFMRSLFIWLFVRLTGKKKDGVMVAETFRKLDSTIHYEVFIPTEQVLYTFSRMSLEVAPAAVTEKRPVLIRVSGRKILLYDNLESAS